MIIKYKTLAELITYKESIEAQIKELKDKEKSGEWTLMSNAPNESNIGDLIKNLEGHLKLTNESIEAIKNS